MRGYMKKIILASVFFAGCSNEPVSNNVLEDAGARILVTDTEVGPENIEPDQDYEYACALTYVQVPYTNTDPSTLIETTLYSHRLWSMPVKRLKETTGHWIAFTETYGITLPDLGNFDFSIADDSMYADIIFNDGTILRDQTVRPTSSGLSGGEWQVCESYSCGPNGCQTAPDPNEQDWSCQSIFNDNGLDNCPCIFNDNGYTYCDLTNDQEKEASGEEP